MTRRVVRFMILGSLLLLNLLLLFYSWRRSRNEKMVSQDQMDAVLSLYEEKEVTFAEIPDAVNPGFTALELKTADVDLMTERFLGKESFDKSYIYGSKVQYNSGSITLLTNRPAHTITYTDESIKAWQAPEDLTDEALFSMLQPLARRFAEKWLDSVFLSEWRQDDNGYRFIYRQLEGDQIYYFNSISLLVTMDGVKTAVLTVWEVSAEGKPLVTLPKDEMLYAGLNKMIELRETPGTIERMYDGYVIDSTESDGSDETAVAVPVQTMILSSGRTITIRYTGSANAEKP
ncbi:MAG: hypothetical protein IJM83_04365 [Firmicutes bacterium]|nr:hypothetical protein [Bacillota bacterium]